MTTSPRPLDTLVVGAGPAGLGTALALAAVDGLYFGVVERGTIGQTFLDWPSAQRFLTPSFTGNGFGSTDLNAIHPNTSPAFSLGLDYPDGLGYAKYLRAVAAHFRLPILERTAVTGVDVDDRDGTFRVATSIGTVRARSLVWAGGEFHHRAHPPITGAELLDHSAAPEAWALRAGDVVVVGGYESGIDLACHHVRRGATVTVVDAAMPWDGQTGGADPSFQLAPRTRQRLKEALATGRLRLVGTDATRVIREDDHYLVDLADDTKISADARPISAVGYGPGLGPVSRLFDCREDGWPLLDQDDQSTTTPGLFLSGPAIRHDRLKFCFVYKFRQRFAHIAGVIGRRLDKDVTALEAWRAAGMLTDDLSCCGVDCAC